MSESVTIEAIAPSQASACIDQLVTVLCECVEAGASVSFMQPFSREKARQYWQGILASSERGERLLLVARQDHTIVGTVQLVLDQPDNQPHRADVAKLLVSTRTRGQGIGQQLMQAVEAAARRYQRTLLVLDTASDTAMRLYARLGWQRVGEIPGYALLPTGEPCATVYFYKVLNAHP